MIFAAWTPTNFDPRFRLLRASAERFSITVHAIRCYSLTEKPISLARFIRSLPENETICVTDAFDVLYSGSLQQIEAHFDSLQKPILFGAESLCNHHLPETQKHCEIQYRNSRYRFLNSGMIVGRVDALREFLAHLLSLDSPSLENRFEMADSSGTFNDQTLFGLTAIHHPELACLDNHAELLWNVSGEWLELHPFSQVENGVVVNRFTATTPALIHFPYSQLYYPQLLLFARAMNLKASWHHISIRLLEQSLERTDHFHETFPNGADLAPPSARFAQAALQRSVQLQRSLARRLPTRTGIPRKTAHGAL